MRKITSHDAAADALEETLESVVQQLHDDLIGRSLRDADARDTALKRIFYLVSKVTEAGIDGEALVRFGLTYEAAFAFLVDLAVGHSKDQKFDDWRETLQLQSPPDPSDKRAFSKAVGKALNISLPALLRWVQNAPFEEVVTMAPPSAELWKYIAESPEPAQEMCDQYRWIVDRLSGQPLKDWSTASLEAEFEWLRGRQPAQIPTAALIKLDYKPEDFAMQIADRNASRKTDPYDPLTTHVDDKAKALLREGRYSDAAALFEFMGEHAKYRKPDCLNNRGFCWIPPDPKKALYFLEQAASRSYRPAGVNVYNQMCCFLALGDHPSVRSLSENYWSEKFEEDPVPATLWIRDGEVWSLTNTKDAREEVAKLALRQAEAEGWPDRVERWTLRLEALLKGEYLV